MEKIESVQVTRRLLLKVFSGLAVYLPLHLLMPECAVGKEGIMNLPRPRLDGQVSVEKAVRSRRTVRTFSPRPLSVEQVSQLLWAAQGITEEGGFKRAAASAGALYPLEVYAVGGSGLISGMQAGIYQYDPAAHSLALTAQGDHRDEISRACLSQLWVSHAPLIVAVCADFQRTAAKYGKRAERYVAMESGSVSQNIFLQAGAMGLVAGIVGAFDDGALQKVLKTPFTPLLIMPIGYR